jgi:hypothetical protein
VELGAEVLATLRFVVAHAAKQECPACAQKCFSLSKQEEQHDRQTQKPCR